MRGDETELIKARLQRAGSMKLIDLVTATFDERVQGGKFWARLATCGLDKVHIDHELVYKYERLLTGGVWANIELIYDYSLGSDGAIRPFVLSRLSPIQIASADFQDYLEGRAQFTRDEWVDVLMRSMGYEFNPSGFHLPAKAAFFTAPGSDGGEKLQPDRTRTARYREILCLPGSIALRHSPIWRTGQRS